MLKLLPKYTKNNNFANQYPQKLNKILLNIASGKNWLRYIFIHRIKLLNVPLKIMLLSWEWNKLCTLFELVECIERTIKEQFYPSLNIKWFSFV